MGRALGTPALGTAKSLASLSPGLLARKGGARPAMRSQLAMMAGPLEDDLGWNDMGYPEVDDSDVALSARVVCFPRGSAPVHRRPRGSAMQEGGKAAFTLRLDAERHSRLRLACSRDARSAQALVTEAVDRLLAEMTPPEALSGKACARPAKRRQS